MSRVILLAADHPMPLYDSGVRRIRTSREGGYTITCEEEGFSVQEHRYYQSAVDDLQLAIRPYRYELNLAPTKQDARLLRDYLSACCTPGEQVELWHLWLSGEPVRAFHLIGRLTDLEEDTLRQMEDQDQTCITITI